MGGAGVVWSSSACTWSTHSHHLGHGEALRAAGLAE
jgi:hypothetical protein